MGKYNFDDIPDRRNTNSLKWDEYPEDVLPLWVADTDFAVAPQITDAIRKRLEHPIFGYSLNNRELLEVFCKRMETRYGWRITPDSLFPVPGIVTGFNFAVRAYCGPTDSVIYQTPAYPPFIHAPENFALQGIPNKMFLNEADGKWSVDFDLFESQIRENTRLFILCNPQNPTGRVFSREELTRLAEICEKHNVLICSDEIHNEILRSGVKHTPIASISPEIGKRTITFMAPSKTFNIPGLSCSLAIIEDPGMRDIFRKATSGLCSFVTDISQCAALAAYRDVDDWLEENSAYLDDNRDYALRFIAERMPSIRVSPPEGTFLLWLDCSRCGIEGAPAKFFEEKARVGLNDGAYFGEGFESFVRLNIGTNRATLQEALERMERALA